MKSSRKQSFVSNNTGLQEVQKRLRGGKKKARSSKKFKRRGGKKSHLLNIYKCE